MSNKIPYGDVYLILWSVCSDHYQDNVKKTISQKVKFVYVRSLKQQTHCREVSSEEIELRARLWVAGLTDCRRKTRALGQQASGIIWKLTIYSSCYFTSSTSNRALAIENKDEYSFLDGFSGFSLM